MTSLHESRLVVSGRSPSYGSILQASCQPSTSTTTTASSGSKMDLAALCRAVDLSEISAIEPALRDSHQNLGQTNTLQDRPDRASPQPSQDNDVRGCSGEHVDGPLQSQSNGPGMDFTDQAVVFVDRILANHDKLLSYNRHAPDMNAHNFSVAAPKAVLIRLAVEFLATREGFRRHGKNTRVDIGYHYSKKESINVPSVQGLFAKDEKMSRVENLPVQPSSDEATFGEGIYTSMNPFSYHKWNGSDQGVLVARIQGQSSDFGATETDDILESTEGSDDTIIGRRGDADEVWVLQSSRQIVPLVKFSADLVELDNDGSVGNDMVYTYHAALQQIVDECFNSGAAGAGEDARARCPITRFLPSQVKWRGPSGKTRVVTFQQVLSYVAPDTLPSRSILDLSKIVVPNEITKEEAVCSICLNDLCGHGPVVQFLSCSHQFHQSCAQQILQSSHHVAGSSNNSTPKCCPNCRASLGEEPLGVGTMPSGSMHIQVRSDLVCRGYEAGTIAITYVINKGIQKAYHDSPGRRFDGTIRAAFLPDCTEGRQLLKRLEYAFLHGLTFTICGRSSDNVHPLSVSRANTVTWASIHHKTRIDSGGWGGYPDPSYFASVNGALDALRVPSVNNLVE